MAESVLAQVPGCGMSAEDLVSELTVRLLERAGRGDPALGAGVRNVRAVLRHRLRQIASEHAPSRSMLKELGVHVREVLKGGLPPPAPRPDALESQGRLQRDKVRQAIGWAIAVEDAPADPRGLTRWLAREYSLLSEPLPLEALATVGRADPGVGALRLARRLAARLGHEETEVLQLKLAGAPLREIAGRLSCSVSTACARMQQLQEEIAQEVRAADAPVGQVRDAFRLLAGVRLDRTGLRRSSRPPG